MNNNNICSICKQNNLSIDFSKIKSAKIKKFINNNQLGKEDLLTKIKKCKCNNNVHKFCILLNVIFNFELKCSDCNTFYDIVVIKKKNSIMKCKLIIFATFLFLIHIILYGCCAALVLINLKHFKMNDFSNPYDEKYLLMQYFFAIILFILNSYLFYLSIKSMIMRFKKCYFYYIDIKEKSSNNPINDAKYFTPLYEFYRYFNNDKLRHLVCKRNEIFFYNKITYNNDFKNFIKKNSTEFNLSNGNQNFIKFNNNEEILKLNNSNKNMISNDSNNEDNTKKLNKAKTRI
jgi:hypothetical protein